MQIRTNTPRARSRLVVGMIGFSRRQESEVDQLLAGRSDAAVTWRTGTCAEADAWWINGARAQPLVDGSLRIGSAEPGGPSVRLALADVNRPIAFAEPLASVDLEPAYSFRIDDAASVFAVLDTIETKWLASTVVRRWLAGQLVAAEHALVQRVYHLVCGGRLLAVIDRAGDIGWLPSADVGALEAAEWIPRPVTAAFVPPEFHRTTISELVWDYAQGHDGGLLPDRYRTQRIHLRRPPRIASRLVGDDHLLVMRELAVRPASFAELEQRTGLHCERLARSLAALYLTGSITTNERRVRQGLLRRRSASAAPSTHPAFWSSSRGGSGFGAGEMASAGDISVQSSLASLAWEPVATGPHEGAAAGRPHQDRP